MALSTRYNHKEVEQGKYQKWMEKGFFLAGDKSKPKFSMVIPPPNVTGKLHLGHAANTTLQDILARYKKAQGYDVLWLPGMDHAGIATQAKVEAKLRESGITRFDLGREKFVEKVWEWKTLYADSIRQQWAKMGLSLDYSRERFTLDEGLSQAVNHVFVELYKQGLIYQGKRIINWDPLQMTALSNIEVIYKEVEGDFFYFKYPIVGDESRFLEIATTRPETMFGDVCVVVNPTDLRYQDLIGKKVINPANGEAIPIIADEYVEVAFGTGAMKCTPAHDPNDYIIGEKYGFPKIICMNKDASMNEVAGKYCGQDRFVCRKNLVEDIRKAGNLIKIDRIIHQVGHSERSDAIIEPYLSKQWFVKMRPLANQSIKNQESDNAINFFPDRFNKVFLGWMERIEDWCISRQLWWGHKIPAYYHKETGEIIVSAEPPEDLENYIQDEDVLDTWFSSALWPFSTLGWPHATADLDRYFPIDVLVTAYDIIFFWVSRMIFQSLQFTKKVPFKDALIHGLIRDPLGRKMTKSLGNGVDPIDVIDKYGADALRYFITTASTPGLDTRYIEEKVASSANYLNKIWNMARFILGNLPADFNEQPINKDSLNPLDRYIMSKLNYTIQNVTQNMDHYEFGNASTHLYNFVYDDFCSWYLEMAKVTLQSGMNRDIALTQQVLYHVLKSIIMMIYPYAPFICEELYQNIPQHLESIMEEKYPVVQEQFLDTSSIDEVETLFSLIKDVRTYKVEKELAPNAKIDLHIFDKKQLMEKYEPYFLRFTFAEHITYHPKSEDLKDYQLYIYSLAEFGIKDNIDKLALKIKLEEEISKLEAEVTRCEKMLSNPAFVDKAPAQKILLEKEKLGKYREQLMAVKSKHKAL